MRVHLIARNFTLARKVVTCYQTHQGCGVSANVVVLFVTDKVVNLLGGQKMHGASNRTQSSQQCLSLERPSMVFAG